MKGVATKGARLEIVSTFCFTTTHFKRDGYGPDTSRPTIHHYV